MDLAPDFSEFFGLLTEHRVEYVVVGAYALALHGAPRYTGDMDILVRPTLHNAHQLLTAIRTFGFPTEALTPDAVVASSCLIQMGTPPVQLHIMSAIEGVTWDRVWASRDIAPIDGLIIPFIGREAFIENKRAAGRAKDLADIEALGGLPDAQH
ncbi:MAG: hypothetical protein ABIP90_02545 [Vicinamibacterales bacterium]